VPPDERCEPDRRPLPGRTDGESSKHDPSARCRSRHLAPRRSITTARPEPSVGGPTARIHYEGARRSTACAAEMMSQRRTTVSPA